MKKALLYEQLENQAVRCTACRQYCTILPGHTGICGVRQNRDGDLYLLVYGKASAVHIDPIEKKPLHHFLPGTKIFSLGTVGCNFACSFCQNWDISQVTRDLKTQLLKERAIEHMDVEVGAMGYELSPSTIVSLTLKDQIPSIAYTYNEPTIFFEYLYDTSQLAHEKGLRNVLVSNGYASDEALEKLEECVDAFNIDLKSFSDEFYRSLCRARLAPVLDTIKKVYAAGIWLEVTTLLIPGKNDSDEELTKIAEFLVGISKEIPWHLSAFFPQYKMQDVPPTSLESLVRAYEIGKRAGLQYIYIGNIPDDDRASTYCPRCKKVLIKRRGYSVTVLDGFGGTCPQCQEKIPGVWN